MFCDRDVYVPRWKSPQTCSSQPACGPTLWWAEHLSPATVIQPRVHARVCVDPSVFHDVGALGKSSSGDLQFPVPWRTFACSKRQVRISDLK